MPEVFVSKVDDFAEGDRRIVFHGGLEIGVFHWQGNFYAYENLCLHQGGPCCEGVIMHKVEDVLAPDKTWLGQCVGNRKLRLKSFEILRRGDELYVVAG
jgi:nitrite reductase/ring-hydroxylating ferredoxin subunit